MPRGPQEPAPYSSDAVVHDSRDAPQQERLYSSEINLIRGLRWSTSLRVYDVARIASSRDILKLFQSCYTVYCNVVSILSHSYYGMCRIAFVTLELVDPTHERMAVYRTYIMKGYLALSCRHFKYCMETGVHLSLWFNDTYHDTHFNNVYIKKLVDSLARNLKNGEELRRVIK